MVDSWSIQFFFVHLHHKQNKSIRNMVEELKKMFAKLGDKEQVDVMVDFYNYIFSIQQDEFKQRIGIE